MGSWEKHIPEGCSDMLFEDCSRKVQIIDSLRNLYTSRGFREIMSPTLEFYDVFNRDSSSIEQEKMYKLFDSTGRILVLRPDLTTPIARIAATKLKEEAYPIRVCYSGNVFRVNEIWDGKKSEITQSGIEILGIQSLKADTEAIVTSIEALLSSGVKNFKIEIGQAEFFRGIIEDIDMTQDEIETLRMLVERKNYTSLGEFVEAREYKIGRDTADALRYLPGLFGGIDVLNKARNIVKIQRALKAVDSVEEIWNAIKSIGLESYLAIDLGMVQHINYYTGVIFRGYSNELGSNILSGGRYDNLSGYFGKAIPAVGFAVNVDGVMQVLERQGGNNYSKCGRFLIFFDDKYMNKAYKLSERLREKGFTAEMSLLENLDRCLEYCSSKSIDRIVWFADEDYINVMNVTAKSSRTMKIENFIEFLGDWNEVDKNCNC